MRHLKILSQALEDVGERLADIVGIYGATPTVGDNIWDHPDQCMCRICFTAEVSTALEEVMKKWQSAASLAQ